MHSSMAKLGLMVALVCFLIDPSHSAECGKHDRVVAFLISKYQEERSAIGTISNKGYMELFVNKQSGTWTLLVTDTRGISCIRATGEHYQRAKGLPKDPNA